jgi:predicted dithiol-disulfide oxidoreductase (DUF899 family)
MAVTPADIAVALGRTAPESDTTTHAQWAMWVNDAEMLIETRRMQVDPDRALDEAKVDYVVREAVVAQVRRPDDATQVMKTVDDGSVTRTYKSSRGRVEILDEWWTLLGLVPDGGGAYSIDTAPRRRGAHLPWCDIYLGGDTCSCGANLTRYEYPLYEGGVLSPAPDWWGY